MSAARRYYVKGTRVYDREVARVLVEPSARCARGTAAILADHPEQAGLFRWIDLLPGVE